MQLQNCCPGLGLVNASQSVSLQVHVSLTHCRPSVQGGVQTLGCGVVDVVVDEVAEVVDVDVVAVVGGATHAPPTHRWPAAQQSLRPHFTLGALHFFLRFLACVVEGSVKATAASVPPASARSEVRRVRCSLNRLTNWSKLRSSTETPFLSRQIAGQIAVAHAPY